MGILVNKKEIETFVFSGGECHVKITASEIGDNTDILANLYNANDIMYLLLAVDAIRRINPKTAITLTMPYIPYARQDRVCNKGEALSIKVMATLINGLKCDKVIIIDPHSDVTSALINNIIKISLSDIVVNSALATIIHKQTLTLLAPDAGAEKKVQETAKALSIIGINTDVLCARKTRDPLTGKILETTLHSDCREKNVIILDDICDGGRTFIELAKTVKEQGGKDLYLYTTHGLFSQGFDTLKRYFKHIYCYHTMWDKKKLDPTFITIINDTTHE